MFIRTRPLTSSETASLWQIVPKEENLEDPTHDVIEIDDSAEVARFSFERIFGMSASNADVYEEMAEPVVGKCLEGFNTAIFAYGQVLALNRSKPL